MIDDSDFIFAQSLRGKKCFCWCHTNTLGTNLRRFPQQICCRLNMLFLGRKYLCVTLTLSRYNPPSPALLLNHLTWYCRSFASFLLCSGWHWLSQQPSRNLNVSSTSWFEPRLAKLHFCKCVLLFYSGHLSWCITKQDPFFFYKVCVCSQNIFDKKWFSVAWLFGDP